MTQPTQENTERTDQAEQRRCFRILISKHRGNEALAALAGDCLPINRTTSPEEETGADIIA